jgi:hypothetical protein
MKRSGAISAVTVTICRVVSIILDSMIFIYFDIINPNEEYEIY